MLDESAPEPPPISPERRNLLEALIPEAPQGQALEALETVIKVINHESVPLSVARKAVGMVLGQYEEGLLTVLVGVAKARTQRLMALMAGMSRIEDNLMRPEMLQQMTPNAQLKLYRTLQFSFTGDLSMLQDVVEMRARIEAMTAHGLPLSKMADTDPMDEKLTLALPPAKRERLRVVLGRVLKAAQADKESD